MLDGVCDGRPDVVAAMGALSLEKREFTDERGCWRPGMVEVTKGATREAKG